MVLQAWKTQEGQAVPRSWHCGPGELKGDGLCPTEGGTAGLEDSGGAGGAQEKVAPWA